MTDRFQKRPGDQLVVAVDFSRLLNDGETLLTSNARGALARTIRDSAGTDVTGTLSESGPVIVAGTRVAFWLLAGVAGGAFYQVEVIAPTSDGELLTERVALEVLA